MSISEAIHKINAYLRSNSKKPFFVFADSSSDYTELFNALHLSEIRASDYCRDDDSLPDLDMLYDDLKQLDSDSIILGVGTAVKITGNAQILGRIKDLTLPVKLVVLCRGIRDTVDELKKSDVKFNMLRYSILMQEYDCSFVKVSPLISLKWGCTIKQAIRNNEDGKSGKIYINTSNSIVSDYEVNSSYDVIIEKEPSFPIDKPVLSEEQWTDYLNDKILEGYGYTHWRTYLKGLLSSTKNEYLDKAIKSSTCYSDFRVKVYNHILDIPYQSSDYWRLYSIRKNMLKDAKYDEISFFLSEVKKKGDEKVFYLTDNTSEERRLIIKEIARTKTIPKQLEIIYPALANYMYEYVFVGELSSELTGYFSEYKLQKMINQIDSSFIERVLKISSDGHRLFNRLPSKNRIIESFDDGKTALCWVDALGVEYLGYIQKRAAELHMNVVIKIGCSNIPTLTDKNKDFFDSWSGPKMVKEEELDKLKHEGVKDEIVSPLAAPLHIERELLIIDEILLKIAGDLKNKYQSVVIASDHGASRLAVINNAERIIEMSEKGIHSGRCCPVSELSQRPDCASEENGFWVLADYSRFKGGRKSSVEVHGGASLEEIIVPIIKFTLKDYVPKPEITILTLNPQYTHNTPPVVKLYCPYKVSLLVLKMEGQSYIGVETEENIYEFRLNDIRRSRRTINADCFEGDNYVRTFEFEISSRAVKTNNDDDFFD